MSSTKPSTKTIILGADHAGFALKAKLAEYLAQKGIDVMDVGCHTEASVDYPCVAEDFANAMLEKKAEKGVICCGSGVGVSIGVNRFPHIRAVLASDETTARLSRQHNDANVLCLGARLIAPELAFNILQTWLDTPFEGGRHQKRVDQLTQLNLS
ncbi:MAG: ribose 5-phosphate isomerase B [Vampirovibrionales bacterium]|nr:ribose 5-phosphate isomerase B [Vampirovibrionales bacterium]